MPDLTRDIIYRGFTVNDEDILANSAPGVGAGTGIIGCVVDSMAISDVDVVQFMEKRSQGDGMDVGTPFHGVRRIRLSGTLYNVSRNLLYDDLNDLRAALNPVLAAREEPLDYGYRPLYYSVPTNREEDYPAGAIELMVYAMPRAFDAMFNRETLGGDDLDALAIPWQATLICRDPGIYAASPRDQDCVTNAVEAGMTTSVHATDIITHTAHGLVAGDRITFSALTGGTGLVTGTAYWVIATNLTADTFMVSATSGGSTVNHTTNITAATYVKSFTDSGDLANNRGTYLASLNALWYVGPQGGSIAATIGDSTFTVTVPASTGNRYLRFKGGDKVFTIEEDSVEGPYNGYVTFSGDTTWPLLDPGEGAYSFTFHGVTVLAGSHFWFYEQFA